MALYHQTSGGPVEVKRHQIMGPVGYNLVGSPTIKDGIATDFTTTSYLMTNLQFDFSQTDYEFVIRATPHAVSTRNAAIVGTQPAGLRIYFMQDKIECIPATGGATPLAVRGTFDVSSFYYVRLIRKGNVYTLDYSSDGINYTGTVSVTNQQHLSSNLFLQFGYYGGDGWDPLDGKIDFNHTYIKANNELWFYQPQETKYIIRDGNLVWADPRIALSGPVNYGIVGNPTITDNIITQANNSNHVNIPSADIPFTQYWEFVTYVQLGSLTIYPYGISNYNQTNKARWQIGTSLTKLRFIAGYDNGWTVDITGTTNFSAGDWIYIKLNFTAATRTFTLYSSVDGVNWTNEGSDSSQVYEDGTGNVLNLMNDPSSSPAFLSMDLNKTYIKTDESLWFYGKNYATSNIAPVPAGYHTKGKVGCVAVGNPTITNGVVSGFSQNDYTSINKSVNIKNITETMFKLYIDTSTITEDFLNFFLLQDGIRIQYYFNKNLNYGINMKIYIAGAGHTSTSRNIPTDTWFYLKTTYDGTTYKAFKSLDKITWEELMSFDVDLSSEEDTTSFRIGSNQTQSVSYFRGSVDLNETYMKTNNGMWFDGKGQCPFTGYVDMRTQTFTAAPSGATMGRDE